MDAGQWLAIVVLAAWRYDERGLPIEPITRYEDELETRLWCYAWGLDPEDWYGWCNINHDELLETSP